MKQGELSVSLREVRDKKLYSATSAGSVWDVMGMMAARFHASVMEHLSVNGNRVASIR